MKFRIFTLTIALVSVAGLFAACGDTTTTSNNSRANVTNLGANNANTGAIVLSSNANANMSNRWSNANVSRADYDKSRSDYERDKGSSTIGSGANDSWLWFKTRAALLTTSDLRESTINVDVVNDVVTLKGTVANAAEKAKAEQVSKGIDGVKSVKNELTVAPNDSMMNTSGNSSNMKKR
ncbi:MAG: BON domain-containing protein [Acidobacteriota bacterium]